MDDLRSIRPRCQAHYRTYVDPFEATKPSETRFLCWAELGPLCPLSQCQSFRSKKKRFRATFPFQWRTFFYLQNGQTVWCELIRVPGVDFQRNPVLPSQFFCFLPWSRRVGQQEPDLGPCHETLPTWSRPASRQRRQQRWRRWLILGGDDGRYRVGRGRRWEIPKSMMNPIIKKISAFTCVVVAKIATTLKLVAVIHIHPRLSFR